MRDVAIDTKQWVREKLEKANLPCSLVGLDVFDGTFLTSASLHRFDIPLSQKDYDLGECGHVLPNDTKGASFYLPLGNKACKSWHRWKIFKGHVCKLTSTEGFRVPTGLRLLQDDADCLVSNTSVALLHFVLVPTVGMSLEDYTAKVQSVLQGDCFRFAQGGGQGEDPDWDEHPRKPTLLAARGLVMALRHLAEHTADPNTALLCFAVHQHIKAIDPVLTDLPRIGIIPRVSIAALEAFPPTGDEEDAWVNTAKFQLSRMAPTYQPQYVSMCSSHDGSSDDGSCDEQV